MAFGKFHDRTYYQVLTGHPTYCDWCEAQAPIWLSRGRVAK